MSREASRTTQFLVMEGDGLWLCAIRPTVFAWELSNSVIHFNSLFFFLAFLTPMFWSNTAVPPVSRLLPVPLLLAVAVIVLDK